MYRRRRIEGKCKGGGWRDEETERTIKRRRRRRRMESKRRIKCREREWNKKRIK